MHGVVQEKRGNARPSVVELGLVEDFASCTQRESGDARGFTSATGKELGIRGGS